MAVNQRRQPKQARSKATCEAILTATTQVLVERGYAGLTTNRVAEVAGASIGTLYQYFSDKDELVRAVIDRHADQLLTLLGDTLFTLGNAPIPVAVRTFVRAMVDAHAMDPKLHRVCLEQAFHLGLDHILSMRDTAITMVAQYLRQHEHVILPTNIDLAASVLVICVDSLAHGAMLQEQQPNLDEMADETIAVVLRYLGVNDIEMNAGTDT